MTLLANERYLSPEGQPERFELPKLVDVYAIDRREVGITADVAPASIQRYIVEDPFIHAIPEKNFQLIRAQEAQADIHARIRRLQGKWDRTPGTAYVDDEGVSHDKRMWEWGDPTASDAFFGAQGIDDPGLRAWRTLVPTAAALAYLSDPFRVTKITSNRREVVDASDDTRNWLAGCTDAEAIRSRATGMAEYAKAYIARHNITNPGEPVSMMSIACGTALPTLQAAMHAEAKDATLLLVDKDTKSMALTEQLAKEIGFEGHLVSEKVDIFDPVSMKRLKDELTKDGVDRRPHLVDAMGIFEYTSETLRTPDKADDPSLLYDPVAFLKAGFDLVRPGGRYIFGQMRDDRPVSDFTMGVVRWPYVCMRSPQEVMEIVKKADIDPSWVTLSLTPEGVYTIASIDKPQEMPAAANIDAVVTETSTHHTVLNGLRRALKAVRDGMHFGAHRPRLS